MNRTLDCTDIADRLLEAAASELRPEFQAHLDACGACARLVRRERRLVAMLRSQPRAPTVSLTAPRLPAGRPVRIRVPQWAAAAAAAALLAVAAWHWTDTESSRLRIDRVVDIAEAPPPVDERLLALTGGFEAVAMRRPTESR